MGIKKTLGGDRLGSGNRMKQEMHDFYRSNKNLSSTCATTMAPGVLYPVYTNIAVKGDTFDIDMNAFVRTVPTIGPLYGSFKLQLDAFQVPFRLYQAILHNNTTDIARKMNQVYLPQIKTQAIVKRSELEYGFEEQIHESALLRYTNISGLGTPIFTPSSPDELTITREFLAIPTLAYYDIFKNYYANQQEENAYVIIPEATGENNVILSNLAILFGFSSNSQASNTNNITVTATDLRNIIQIRGNNLEKEKINIIINWTNSGGRTFNGNIQELLSKYPSIETNETLSGQVQVIEMILPASLLLETGSTVQVKSYADYIESGIKLQDFPLTNIDNMRKYLLTQWDLGTKVVLDETNQNYYPYLAVTEKQAALPKPNNAYPMNGLVVKCYQSDMFNNWLDTDWVNEITQESSIDVSSGSFTIDMLNFKKKLYDHLNRLAISGGTYDDWQEATYGDKVWSKAEKPIYCGGMSSEVVFDEVVSTAASGEQPLGTIGGQGQLTGRKGGNITIKVGEASVIMIIASLTPRLMYTQGNAWYNTELKTMDDLHKPIFDRIGFQDLITEQMAWFATRIDPSNTSIIRTSAGKQPAWMQYATDIDRAYGDFARGGSDKTRGLNYMVLTRNYEQTDNGDLKDCTTYIDPQKFNYAFVYQKLDAQNFWSFFKFKIHARRKMSNTQIPNV